MKRIIPLIKRWYDKAIEVGSEYLIFNHEYKQMLYWNFYHEKFEKDAILLTDSHSAYPGFASKEKIQLEQIETDKHAKGAFNLGRVNALHSDIAKYWPKQQERIPSTKYMDLSLMLMWWLRKHDDLTTNEKVEKLI